MLTKKNKLFTGKNAAFKNAVRQVINKIRGKKI